MAAVAMPQHSRQRSNSSVDQLFELVDELDDSQIHTLLEDFNNTVASNIQVSHGIDLFGHQKQQPKQLAARAASTRRSAFTPPRLPLAVRPPLSYLTRSKSKRQSSAPAPISRPRTALPPTPKHYRRISRPVLPSPNTSGPDLNALLSAYLSPVPPPSKSSASSPLSPRSMSSSSTMSFEAEDVGMDSLAPLVFGRPQREAGEMSDIFEVLQF